MKFVLLQYDTEPYNTNLLIPASLEDLLLQNFVQNIGNCHISGIKSHFKLPISQLKIIKFVPVIRSTVEGRKNKIPKIPAKKRTNPRCKQEHRQGSKLFEKERLGTISKHTPRLSKKKSEEKEQREK